MSSLYLKAKYCRKRTVISDSFFTAPLKIAKPFYHNNYTEVMMMSASAGILEGDFYDIKLELEQNASLKITGQSYTKLFAATEKGASQNVRITADENTELLYCPTPVIPFAGSVFRSSTEIYLKNTSRFAMTDIISCGRKAMSETFALRSYRARTVVYVENKPVFLDNQYIAPDETDFSSIGFFEGYTHIGMMYIYGYELDILPESDSIEAGISQASQGACIRIMGKSGDDIIRYANKIFKFLRR